MKIMAVAAIFTIENNKNSGGGKDYNQGNRE